MRRLALLAVLAVSGGAIACSNDAPPGPRMCFKTDCSAMGNYCGEINYPDGTCIDCGDCQRPSTCGGTGVANACGCRVANCRSFGANCGLLFEPCSGAMLPCGMCTVAGETCGGGGQENVCGRTLMRDERCGAPNTRCAPGLACCGDRGAETCVTAGLGGGCPGPSPDLSVDASLVPMSLSFEQKTFTSTDCAVLEGCTMPGNRRLMRFTAATVNNGAADLDLGSPDDPPNNPQLRYSMCRSRYERADYMRYRLLAADGAEVAPPVYAPYCVEDTIRSNTTDPTVAIGARFRCGNIRGEQGLQRGWTGHFPPRADCQWIDITALSSGSYTLELTVDPRDGLFELQPDNNTARVPVMIPP